ncbi:vesicle-trafficking protein SEC22a isoform X2 [Vulpes vulpes]|uniref:Vesicle-trafficking protein SEC22a isoform X2 n=2 Tax=Vulpes vulpes TaxID=9627 RepID=A0ABM4XT82_VULVU
MPANRSSLLVEMSMILSASVIRVRDGLPLSASTDYEQGTGVQECRKYFKMLSKKLAQLPDRCTLKTGHYNINFISSLGVSYMMLCTENYPNVLAFSFLDELQKEFITTYNMMKTNTAVRPYCFIEFDNFIQRTKQRYNNPRSLSTKINLSDMQMEIKLRPPYQISMCELGSANGVTSAFSVDYKGAGKISSAHLRLEPATLSGIVAFILSLLCGALNLIRGFHAIESVLQSDGEDFNYVVAFFLGTAACLYQGCKTSRTIRIQVTRSGHCNDLTASTFPILGTLNDTWKIQELDLGTFVSDNTRHSSQSSELIGYHPRIYPCQVTKQC